MRTIEARELAEHAAEVVRQVKSGETIRVLEEGIPIAVITPAAPTKPEHRPYSQEEAEAFIAEMHQLAEEIGKHVTGPVDAVQAVREIRREL